MSPAPVLAERLRDLAWRVRRIGDGIRANPEAVCIAKDEVSKELRRIADDVARGEVHA